MVKNHDYKSSKYYSGAHLDTNLTRLRILTGVADQTTRNIFDYLSGKSTQENTSLDPRDNDRLVRSRVKSNLKVAKRLDLVEAEIQKFEESLAGASPFESYSKRSSFYQTINTALEITGHHYRHSKHADRINSLAAKVKEYVLPILSSSPEQIQTDLPLPGPITREDILGNQYSPPKPDVSLNILNPTFEISRKESAKPVKPSKGLVRDLTDYAVSFRYPRMGTNDLQRNELIEKLFLWGSAAAASIFIGAVGAYKYGSTLTQAVGDLFAKPSPPNQYVSRSAIPPQRPITQVPESPSFTLSPTMQSILDHTSKPYVHSFARNASGGNIRIEFEPTSVLAQLQSTRSVMTDLFRSGQNSPRINDPLLASGSSHYPTIYSASNTPLKKKETFSAKDPTLSTSTLVAPQVENVSSGSGNSVPTLALPNSSLEKLLSSGFNIDSSPSRP